MASDLREICLFSIHNLLRDAPFSRLDLISCRNLLIYFGGDLQDRVIPLFHYALNPGGYLFLGTSENVSRHARLFSTVDKPHRIFQRRANLERKLPQFPLTAPEAMRRGPGTHPARGPAPEPSLKSFAEQAILERFTPAYAVVNQDGELLLTSGRTGKYLELPAGAPDTNIFNLARPGLRLDLRAAIHKAASSNQPVLRPKLGVTSPQGRQEIDLYVQPLRLSDAPDLLYLMVFQDLGSIKPLSESAELREDDVAGANVRQLEAELRATKERLESTTEELKSSNEELRSGNEELSSMNEELQSANEELETSKEELQSINEELQTVNAELNSRVEELSRANNDMANLLESTQIATVFLDRGLLIKSFTPAAKDVFRLVESDAGRPIMHVRPRFELPSLQQDAERVLRTLGAIERPVSSNENGKRYIMRMLPYRTADNVISGVVMTFTDITRISEAEARIEDLTRELRNRVKDLEILFDLVPVGVLIAEEASDQKILANQYGARLLGVGPDHRALRPTLAKLRFFEDEQQQPMAEDPLRLAARTGKPTPVFEGRLESLNGRVADVLISASPLLHEDGTVRGAIGAVVDIAQRKKAETRQRLLLNELQHRVKNILATVTSLATRMQKSQPSSKEFYNGFLVRLAAMARTHDLLSRGSWEGADLRSLMSLSLDTYLIPGRANVRLKGEEILLNPNSATTLGMVFHELATNAAKYGALSTEAGTVDVSWEVATFEPDSQRRVRISWVEEGGPPLDPAHADGFGLSFIRRSVEYEVDGTVEIALPPEGLRCIIEFPLPPMPE